jgi:hypothetical protein
MVLVEGIEPTRPCGHRILSPARLPVPPHQREGDYTGIAWRYSSEALEDPAEIERLGVWDPATMLFSFRVHCFRVHCHRMKNITLSAEEELIEQARLVAKSQRKTLNAAFREWLQQFTRQSGSSQEFDSLMKRLKHVKAGRRFTRDEMNER